jgi:hypothetical protein
MVDWRKLETAVDRKINGAFGETVRLSFMKDGKHDPARSQTTVRCHGLSTDDDVTRPAGSGLGGNPRVGFAGAAAVLFLDRGSYEGPALQPGDRVRAMDRHGEPVWQVEFISDRHSNLISVVLIEL